MEKKVTGVVILLAVLFGFGLLSFDQESTGEVTQTEAEAPAPAPAPTTPAAPAPVNYQQYNIDYMNDAIKAILVRQLGANGKTAFYLPSTGYINASKGTKYGVAFAIQNVNPNVPDGNRFAYDFKADASVMSGCGVSVSEAQSWIERGWTSSGMISGQWREDYNDWYDAMTIYFAFPSSVQSGCNVKYNFEITKDGAPYDSRQLEFNIA